MATLKKLPAALMNKIIDDTRAELAPRKNVNAATAGIRSIFKLFKINVDNIDLNIITKTGCGGSLKNRARVAKLRHQRNTVQAKCKDPNATATWTGRS